MIKLHQMLHGYKLGHNYIQGSIVLSSSHDMDKIATLSDWSEYVGIDNKRDYITAYMLDESPYYVVAKTWYAENMKRPGCVWTHSLLIPKDDLSEIKDFRGLLYYFALPKSEDFDSYSAQLDYTERLNDFEMGISEIGEKKVGALYEYFLSEKPSFVLNEFGSKLSQELLLTLLNYLPSKILVNKSICSGTASPRAYEGQYLSLQLVAHDGNAINYLSSNTNAPWSQLVAFSVVNHRPQVANLIRRYQNEIGDSINKLVGFLKVVALINRNCRDDQEKQKVLLEIINTLSQTYPSMADGMMFKEDVLQPSLALDFGGEINFLYTFSTIDISPFTKEQVRYENRVHDLSVHDFLGLLKKLYTTVTLNEWGNKLINEVERYICYADISELRFQDIAFFQTIICNNPEILNQITWSDFTREELQTVLPIFSDEGTVKAFKHWSELFRSMLYLKMPIARELIRLLFSHDKKCVGSYLSYLNEVDHQSQIDVSMELENYPVEVLDWLSRINDISYDVAYVLVNSIDEVGTSVKKYGSRVWLPFVNSLTESSSIQFYIFLYRLSFDWEDEISFSFMQKAFYPIHELLRQDKLEYNLWYQIEPYTERLFFLQNWDKCKKLRKMIVKRLQEAGYPKSSVANYTIDEMTNEWLLKDW